MTWKFKERDGKGKNEMKQKKHLDFFFKARPDMLQLLVSDNLVVHFAALTSKDDITVSLRSTMQVS